MAKLILIFAVALLAAAVHCGVVVQKAEDPPTGGFCSRNPESDICNNEDRRMHPDLPDNRAQLAGRASATEASQLYWTKMAEEIVTAHVKRTENKNKAKNIIFFLGDGMGIQTVTAARMLLGDESKQLSFEEFDYTGSVKTYCVDVQVADSACTATAYLGGVKTNDGTIGINAKYPQYDCEGTNDETAYVDSIAKWAQAANKATGFVTTTRVTHASPAGLFAHTSNRDWESDHCVQFKDCDDGAIEDNYSGCEAAKIKDIAQQLVREEVGSQFNVIMGGGARAFFPSTVTDEWGVAGQRRDGLDLIAEWKNDGKANKEVVRDREALLALDTSKTDYVLGLFGTGSHMKFHLQTIQEGVTSEPTLWEMTEKALQIVSKNENGFVIFIESGRIDSAHHNTQARTALHETIQFHETVKRAREMFSVEDTLIIVTADHSHTMSISGYPDRGNDILGIAGGTAQDGKKYFTLNYANSPAYNDHIEKGQGRKDPEQMDTSAWNFGYPGMVDIDSETHGGEDVPIYASGPWAHLFTGTLEQNVIPHFLAYASCLGDGLTMCD